MQSAQNDSTAIATGTSTGNRCQIVKLFSRLYWKILFATIWPLLILIPLLIDHSVPMRCAFVILLMAGYWVTECFPLAVTSLLPVVLFPLLDIMDSTDVCLCYMNDTIMVFIGGLVLAIAIEHCGLHLRIALNVMNIVGCSHAKLLAGLCVVTTFLSMWISNTGATAMMIPIIFAVLGELEQTGYGKVFVDEVDPENPDLPPVKRPSRITRAYLLCTAYSSTFGGTGTFVGTGTNLTFKGIYENTFPKAEEITFGQWMLVLLPQVVCNAFLTWLYLRVAFFGFLRPKSRDAVESTIGAEGERITNEVIQKRCKELGPLKFHEFGVLLLFTLCIFLWIFRKPGFMIGWAEIVNTVSIKDSVPVMLVSILMFFIPKDPVCFNVCNKNDGEKPKKCSEGLITWDTIQSKMPWSLMFLLGGGFAISKASIKSCLAKSIGVALSPLKHFHELTIMFVVILFAGTFTEFTSNVGIANIILPVVAQMCVAMKIHPLYLMIPTTLMCSYAFRLPVGTPPNAIVAIQGHLPTKWLIQGGCFPAIYSLINVMIFFPTWGQYILDIKEFPEWAQVHTNMTDC